MKNILKLTALSNVLLLSACGNLSNVSDEGTTDNPVFPKIEKSGWNHDGTQLGSWENWDNVKQIEKGMNKTQIRKLLGDPQFGEGLYGVREWDYVFNYRENGEHKVCQYKILFDKNMNASQQWWQPNGCNGFAHFNLDADVLFAFDKAELTPEGQAAVTKLAQDLNGASVIEVQGHTDRLGSAQYNMNLSQRRAETVKKKLTELGVNAQINAVGYGETRPVKQCANEGGSVHEKECLQPNRRVTVIAQGQSTNTSSQPGKDGPSKVEAYQADRNKTSW